MLAIVAATDPQDSLQVLNQVRTRQSNWQAVLQSLRHSPAQRSLVTWAQERLNHDFSAIYETARQTAEDIKIRIVAPSNGAAAIGLFKMLVGA